MSQCLYWQALARPRTEDSTDVISAASHFPLVRKSGAAEISESPVGTKTRLGPEAAARPASNSNHHRRDHHHRQHSRPRGMPCPRHGRRQCPARPGIHVPSAAWSQPRAHGRSVRLYKTATAPATPPRNRRCTAAPTVPLHPPPCTGSDTRRRQTRPVHTNSAHATWARGSVWGPDKVKNLRYSQVLIPCVLARAKSWKVHADAGLQHGVVAG
jgi:hypothetical protein